MKKTIIALILIFSFLTLTGSLAFNKENSPGILWVSFRPELNGSGALESTTACVGDIVPVYLYVSLNENLVDSLGFDLSYNQNELNFVEYSFDGSLLENWPFRLVNEPSPGTIRTGAFNLSPLPADGVLVRFDFEVKEVLSSNGSFLNLNRTVDDIEEFQKQGAVIFPC
jgi:hypothetical protein